MPSAVIAQYSYDREKMLLTVSFVSGLVYQYLDVPVEIFEKMRSSFSKGIFLNRYIKPNYRFVKVSPPP